MPTTRSGSNAKKSPSARVDVSLGEPDEGSGSQLLDVGCPNDDLQVCLAYTSFRLAAPRNKKRPLDPSHRPAKWDSESQKGSGRPASEKRTTATRSRPLAQ